MDAALMIPELGHLAMMLALCMALVQSSLPLVGAWRGDRQWMRLASAGRLGAVCFPAVFVCLPDLGLSQ
jgi:cytochrome c-type biogenesis protein CcmF